MRTRVQKRRIHHAFERGLAVALLSLGVAGAYWWYQSAGAPVVTVPEEGEEEPQPSTSTPLRPSTTPVTASRSSTTTPRTATSSLAAPAGMRTYLEVIDSCRSDYTGECVVARSGPSTSYPVVARLRNSIVLEVGESQVVDGRVWHNVIFDEFLRYPERVTSDWWVAGDYVAVLFDEGPQTLWEQTADKTDKRIEVSCADQRLRAYESDELVMDIAISTGLPLTPTPRGTFTIFQKTPSRYMQGPLPSLPSDQVYDMPGVPWNLYFTHGGAVIHGTYWHTSFGSRYSHGCVNLPPAAAYDLYQWAPLGTPVIVR